MKWPLVTLLALHGLIHLMGVAGTWGLAGAEAQIGAPVIPLAGVSLGAAGVIWLAACLALLAAAPLRALDRRGWMVAAGVGVILSQVVVALWWPTAWRGTVANVVIVAALVWELALSRRTQRPAPVSR